MTARPAFPIVLALALLAGGCGAKKAAAWGVVALLALAYLTLPYFLSRESFGHRVALRHMLSFWGALLAVVSFTALLGWAVMTLQGCSPERKPESHQTTIKQPASNPDTTKNDAGLAPRGGEAAGVAKPGPSAASKPRPAPSLTGGFVWPPLPVGPLALDTLTFRAPIRDGIPGTCLTDTSHYLLDSVLVRVERRALEAPPWAAWMSAWHLYRRVALASGEPCSLNVRRNCWYRVTAYDAAGNASCAESTFSAPIQMLLGNVDE